MPADDASLEFPINEQLLEDATRAREEWRVLRDRLAKIDESREQVSPAVHERVRTDYDARLKQGTAELLKRKEAIDGELATLSGTRKKITAQLDDHRQRLEEIKFRNTLGEFSEEKYQSQARGQQDKISKFEAIIAAVDSNIRRYEAVFEAEEELIAELASSPRVRPSAAERPPRGRPQAAPGPPASRAAPAEEESDAFAAPTDADTTSPAIAGEGEEPGAEGSRRARLVVISGEDAGTAYAILGTLAIGRAESNGVVLKDSKASRQHAHIQSQGSEFVLADLNSSNGTYVNGQRVEEHVLSNGDEIQIGDTVLQFQG